MRSLLVVAPHLAIGRSSLACFRTVDCREKMSGVSTAIRWTARALRRRGFGSHAAPAHVEAATAARAAAGLRVSDEAPWDAHEKTFLDVSSPCHCPPSSRPPPHLSSLAAPRERELTAPTTPRRASTPRDLQQPANTGAREDWELPYIVLMGGGLLVLGVGEALRPDRGIESWARDEVEARQRRADAGEESVLGTNYAAVDAPKLAPPESSGGFSFFSSVSSTAAPTKQ